MNWINDNNDDDDNNNKFVIIIMNVSLITIIYYLLYAGYLHLYTWNKTFFKEYSVAAIHVAYYQG
jgi:hypothetical protein